MRFLTLYELYNKRIFALLGSFVALCVFAYGALLLGAVAHTAHRTEAQGQIEHLNAQVSRLESQYLTQTQTLSPERAAALGFVAPQQVATVFASVHTLTLAGQALK